jgi:hypothetical protein
MVLAQLRVEHSALTAQLLKDQEEAEIKFADLELAQLKHAKGQKMQIKSVMMLRDSYDRRLQQSFSRWKGACIAQNVALARNADLKKMSDELEGLQKDSDEELALCVKKHGVVVRMMAAKSEHLSAAFRKWHKIHVWLLKQDLAAASKSSTEASKESERLRLMNSDVSAKIRAAKVLANLLLTCVLFRHSAERKQARFFVTWKRKLHTNHATIAGLGAVSKVLAKWSDRCARKYFSRWKFASLKLQGEHIVALKHQLNDAKNKAQDDLQAQLGVVLKTRKQLYNTVQMWVFARQWRKYTTRQKFLLWRLHTGRVQIALKHLLITCKKTFNHQKENAFKLWRQRSISVALGAQLKESLQINGTSIDNIKKAHEIGNRMIVGCAKLTVSCNRSLVTNKDVKRLFFTTWNANVTFPFQIAKASRDFDVRMQEEQAKSKLALENKDKAEDGFRRDRDRLEKECADKLAENKKYWKKQMECERCPPPPPPTPICAICLSHAYLIFGPNSLLAFCPSRVILEIRALPKSLSVPLLNPPCSSLPYQH